MNKNSKLVSLIIFSVDIIFILLFVVFGILVMTNSMLFNSFHFVLFLIFLLINLIYIATIVSILIRNKFYKK